MARQRRILRYPNVFSIILLLSTILIFLVITHYVYFYKPDRLFPDRDASLNLSLKRPAIRSLNITIVAVINDVNQLSEYRYALDTVRCYSKMHNYPFRIVKSYEYRHCRHRDNMFRRHCVVAEVLRTTDWVLFIDADIGVVNPNRLIEEYIDTDYDITFYDRFCSWEVAMGSYIVKNTDFSREFLMNFANFETHLPDSFHGSDNGAIHAYLLENLVPESLKEAHVCYSIWHQSRSYSDLFLYEACIRSILGSQRNFEKVRIVRKGTGWVRDIWITNSRWSPDRDFMLHGLKETDRLAYPDGVFLKLRSLITYRFTWYPPLSTSLDMQKCSMGNVKWQYDQRLRVSREEVEERLHELARKVEKERWSALGRVKDYL